MKYNLKNEYSEDSLFAGIGGICIAFKQAGCEVIWANEWGEKDSVTYRHNNKTELIQGDINAIEKPSELGAVDIITSGFPCQAFSIAGG